jgi:RNA-directed DNA polymerase
MYHIYYVKKKSGKRRKICAPCAELKARQRVLLKDLEQRLVPHACATGFRKGLSIVDNARAHHGPWLFNIDLSNFFDSIYIEQLAPRLMANGLSPAEITVITDACILPGAGHLPQGAVTSPFLSNLYCQELDTELNMLCQSRNLAYTRYADDITISGQREDILAVKQSVFDAIRGQGLKVNWQKVDLQGPGRRQEVTGLLVNSKISCGRKQYQELRTAIYRTNKALDQGTIDRTTYQPVLGMAIDTLLGRASFMVHVNPTLISLYNNAKTLASRLNRMI